MPGYDEEDTTRRRMLRAGLAAVGGTVAVDRARAGDENPAGNRATEQQPAVTKFTPEAVHYQPTPHDWEKCLYCSFFQPPSRCGIVSGTVSKQGWCDHFTLLHE